MASGCGGGREEWGSDCFVLLSCVLTYVLVCVIHIAQVVVVVVVVIFACIINRLQPGSPMNCARLYATEVCAKCPLLQAKRWCVSVCVCVDECLRHFCVYPP